MLTSYEILFFSVVIVIIIIVVYQNHNFGSICENSIEGFWVGDADFLQSKKLKDFQLYVSPLEKGERKGWLLSSYLDGQVKSCPLSVSVSKVKGTFNGNVTMNLQTDCDELPSQLVAECNVTGTSMTIRHDEETIFKGYRDNFSTKEALKEWNTEDDYEGEKL